MSTPSNNINLKHWLSVHKGARRDIRRYIILLAIISAMSIIVKHKIQDVWIEEFYLAREFTLQVQEKGAREEVAKLYKELCEKDSRLFREMYPKDTYPNAKEPECKGGKVSVKLDDIPGVSWEFNRLVGKNMTFGPVMFQGFELGVTSFVEMLLFVPIGVLVLIILRLKTTAKISKMLRDKADDFSEVQQCLNSVFSERATRKLGERRWFYATIWTLVVLILVIIPLAMLLFYLQYRANTWVEIDALGHIKPISIVKDTIAVEFVNYSALRFSFLVIVLIPFVLGIGMWISTFRQMRPRNNKSEEH